MGAPFLSVPIHFLLFVAFVNWFECAAVSCGLATRFWHICFCHFCCGGKERENRNKQDWTNLENHDGNTLERLIRNISAIYHHAWELKNDTLKTEAVVLLMTLTMTLFFSSVQDRLPDFTKSTFYLLLLKQSRCHDWWPAVILVEPLHTKEKSGLSHLDRCIRCLMGLVACAVEDPTLPNSSPNFHLIFPSRALPLLPSLWIECVNLSEECWAACIATVSLYCNAALALFAHF